MAERTMEELLQALTKGDVPNDAIKLMIFPYSLEDRARIWDVVSKTDDRIDKLANQISNFVEIINKQVIAPAKAVEKTCVTCGGAHAYYECIDTDSNPSSVCAATSSYNQDSPPNRASHQILPPGFASVQNNSNSGLAYDGPSIPTESLLEKVDEQNTKEILDKEHSNSSGSTTQVQPLVVPISILEPDVSRTQSKSSISYPSRLNDQKLREKATNQMEKFFQNFQDLHFDISFADALLLMLKFASTIKSLLANKDKLFELAKVPLNENCSAMLLKKLPEKLGDPGKFLIPCDFPGMEVCHALADLGASINLMPLSIWKKLSLLELTPTRMTLELADRSITHPKGVAKDVFVKVGKFHFPTDFVVVDFEADSRVPLILGRSFLRTGHALIDVYGEEITLMVNDESITFNLSPTMRYSSTCDDTSVNRVDVIDVACEDFVQDILDFQYNSNSSSPTLVSDDLISESKVPIVKSSLPTLTSFGESDFFLKEIEDFLNDDSILIEIENSVFDLEGDILLIKKLLNEDPCSLPPMDLKVAKESKEKYSVEEPPELELKGLPSHLEYAFLEDSNKLLVIIAKNLKVNEREALINSQRRVNPKIHDVIKKEVIKLLDARMIYHISDSLWVSPIHCVPKKGGMTIVANENNELIPTRLVTGNELYCFLDGFSGYFQIPIDPQDQEKTTFTCPYGTFAYQRMPFGLCNALGTFQRCMMCIFYDMIEKTMEVFMDDFLVFGDSFSSCLTNLDKMLNRCEETNLVLNWEKCHFMCREGIVLGHKISKSGIEDFSKIARPITHLLKKETHFVFSKECIDAFNTLKKKLTKASILVVPDWNLPFELMYDASDYAIGAVLGHCKSKNFQPIHYASKTMTEAQIHYTTTEKEMLAVDAKPRLLRWVLLLQEFDIIILYKKGSENLAADHLSRLENLHQDVLKNKDINENFPLETLGSLTSHNTPWFTDIANFRTGNFIKKGLTSQQKKKFFKDGAFEILKACHEGPSGGHHGANLTAKKENYVIYKERTKKLHDFKIKNCIFNVDDQVLLFNSRLNIFSGKLKTRWSGPFTITHVIPYGTIELSQPNGPNFKVNGHRVKHYLSGDIPSNVALDLYTFLMDN
nr:reverse transcriptase domain-containing protein [Tanacetum cinerariifolium]